MKAVRVYIGIGSNRGNRDSNLFEACKALSGLLSEFTMSCIYETRPQIVEDQPSFLNMAAAGFFTGSPEDLLRVLQDIETSLGRDRSKEITKGPRTMDLDILIFGDITLNTEDLTIPHPGIRERAFVLTPLLDIIAPGNPLHGTYKRVLDQLEDQGVEYYKTITGIEALGGKGIE